MQIDQCARPDAWRADCHAGACDRIQHPGGQHNYHAGRRLNVNYPAADTLLAVLPSNTAPMQRMPTVIDLDLIPDMGRMTGRSR